MNRARHLPHRTGITATIHQPQLKADHVGAFLGVVWVLGNIVALALLGTSAVDQPQLTATPNAPATAADTHHPTV